MSEPTELLPCEDDNHFEGTELTLAKAKKAALPYGPCSIAYVHGFIEARSRYRVIENNMRGWMEVKDKAIDRIGRILRERESDNRWLRFSDDELRAVEAPLADQNYQLYCELSRQSQAELTRRTAAKQERGK